MKTPDDKFYSGAKSINQYFFEICQNHLKIYFSGIPKNSYFYPIIPHFRGLKWNSRFLFWKKGIVISSDFRLLIVELDVAL